MTISFLLFTTLVLCITPSPLHAQKATNDLVRTTCSQTSDPTICEAELGSDPRSSNVADTEGLTLIMIDVVKSRFADSLWVAQDLTRITHEQGTIRALKECIRVYQVVLDYNVVEAMNAVKRGNPKFGEQAMLDSGDEVEACKTGFPGGNVPAQLAGQTRTLHGVSDVAASLIKTLE